MSKFILSDVFASMIITGSIQSFTTTEGAEFDIMALTKELKDDVELCESYADMIALAADSGLSCDGDRAIDDDYLAENIHKVWESDLLDDECDPSTKEQVGIKVCEISGLSSVIEAQKEKEIEAARVAATEALIANGIDGDKLPEDEVMLEDLESDAAAHNQVNRG